jgi:hypothetical protein
VLELVALVACLSNEPMKCGVVKTFADMAACEAAKDKLPPIPWAPLHCEIQQVNNETEED